MSVARVVLVVPADATGRRLDRVVAAARGVGTRSQAKQLIDAGCVRVDGAVCKASHAVRAGERVEIDAREPEPFAITMRNSGPPGTTPVWETRTAGRLTSGMHVSL